MRLRTLFAALLLFTLCTPPILAQFGGTSETVSATALPDPPFRAQGQVYSDPGFYSSQQNLSYNLFSANPLVGQRVVVKFKGPAHLKVSAVKRITGEPLRDAAGQPLTWQYVGTFPPGFLAYTTTYSFSFILPVSASDAILVVKNPELQTGAIGYQVYYEGALTYRTPPITVPRNVRFVKVAPGRMKVSWAAANTSSVTITMLEANYDALQLNGAFVRLNATPHLVGPVAPGGSVSTSFECNIVGRLRIRLTAHNNGENYSTDTTLLVPVF